MPVAGVVDDPPTGKLPQNAGDARWALRSVMQSQCSRGRGCSHDAGNIIACQTCHWGPFLASASTLQTEPDFATRYCIICFCWSSKRYHVPQAIPSHASGAERLSSIFASTCVFTRWQHLHDSRAPLFWQLSQQLEGALQSKSTR